MAVFGFGAKRAISRPIETTQNRADLTEARRQLQRAKRLKARSAAVAASLAEEGSTNHWQARIRIAYGGPQQ